MAETKTLTLFTAPKAFRGHVGVIQENAIRSWLALGPGIEILLFGEDPGIREAAASLSVRHLPSVARGASGAPLLSSVFEQAQREAHSPVLCYLNADILLLDDFSSAVELVAQGLSRFLIVGQRWDVDIREPIGMEGSWQGRLRAHVRRAGSLHPPVGSDFFAFPAGQYDSLPPFTIGRSGWDNWMIYDGRRRRIPVVDVSTEIMVVHQNHDYSHLPGGKPHYRHPESIRNLQLAGGREAIFRLEDSDWVFASGRPLRKGFFQWRYPRRWEADLIARWGPGRASRLVRLGFHPSEMLRYVRDTLAGRPKKDDAVVRDEVSS